MSEEPTVTERRILTAIHDLNVNVAKLARDVRALDKKISAGLTEANGGAHPIAFDVEAYLKGLGEGFDNDKT